MILRKCLPYAGLWLALSVFYGSITDLSAQDPSFSQFYANRIYLNPAFAGLERGVTVNSVARMQWTGIDRGFRTYDLTVETQLPALGIGVGLHVLRDEEGLSRLTTNQAGMVFSYTIPGKKSNFHFGLEARVVQKTINWDKLVFSDQIDPWDGLVGPGALSPVLDNVAYGDLDFGFVWRHDGRLKLAKKRTVAVRSHLGASFHHLPYLLNRNLSGTDSFLNKDYRVAPRTTIHGGMIIPIRIFSGTGTEVAFSPNFKLDSQGEKFMSFRENLTVGTVGFYTLVNNFYMGLLYQNRLYLPNQLHTDSYIFTFGAYTNAGLRKGAGNPSLFLGFSVDLNTTGIGPVTGNVYEFTLRYRFLEQAGFGMKLRGRSKSGNVLDCKNFF